MIRSSLALLCALAMTVTATLAFGEPARRDEWRRAYVRPVEIPFPPDNPHTLRKVELGRALFFDPAFSRSGTLSCASCHNPALSWGDGKPRAVGDAGTPLALRAPTLLNVAWTDVLGWDGKFPDLESVAFTPITGKANMNMTEGELVERLGRNPAYVQAFRDIFGPEGITRRTIELALATYERTIVSPEAPFDRWIAGDETAMDEAAKRGFDLFNGKAQCAACHSGWAMTDGSFHDIGTAKDADIGRGRLFPGSQQLQHAFKTPTLRDVALRAPYMHDGSVATLRDVIDLYVRGGIDRPSRSPKIRPLHLSEEEKQDLIAFLDTLTSDTITATTRTSLH